MSTLGGFRARLRHLNRLQAFGRRALSWDSAQFVDGVVPTWTDPNIPKRTVCGSALHDIGIGIQNNAAIDATNASVVTLYVKDIKVGP